MKKIGFFALFALLNVGIAFAQPPQSGKRVQRATVEERAKQTTEWMTKELELTKEQIVRVDSINLLFAKVQQSYYQTVDGDNGKIREAMLTLRKEKEEALSKVLTTSQLETYKAKNQELIRMRTSGSTKQEENDSKKGKDRDRDRDREKK